MTTDATDPGFSRDPELERVRGTDWSRVFAAMKAARSAMATQPAPARL